MTSLSSNLDYTFKVEWNLQRGYKLLLEGSTLGHSFVYFAIGGLFQGGGGLYSQLLNQNRILAMSDQEVVVVNKRKTNRLNLDSEEEARLEAEQQARLDETRQRKQEKRRRKEEEARRAEEQAKRRLQQQQKYENPETMLLEDSDQGDSFSRVEKKIRKAYPEFKAKEESYKRRHVSESEESQQEDSQEESKSEESQSRPKRKQQKKAKRERKVEESDEVRQARQKVERAKVEQEDPKERLVKEVAVRWWYCLPEWPPADYPYDEQLKKLGYRLVDQNRFRMEENLVNGLIKATHVDGYIGVFRTKQKILDIRPKQAAPSLNFLRSKTMDQLSSLLRAALKEQTAQLSSQQYHQNEQLQLLQQLRRRLNELL